MNRYLLEHIRKDLDKKIVILSGPRQVGKTTLSREIYPSGHEYFNMDNEQHRLLVRKMEWRRDCEVLIFDELHKIPRWKSWIKGVYDTLGVRPRLLVTGSARLDTYRKGGDSLAGRHFSYRLHPFSVAEVKGSFGPDTALDRILKYGGFPEPFLMNDHVGAKRWRSSHIDRILKSDVFDVAAIHNLRGMETLAALLRDRVGSVISFDSLARDLQVSAHTVKFWIGVLESLYVVFVVTPYTNNIARGLLKQPKIFFYDTGSVNDDPGARFENAVACALLKRQHYFEDVYGERCALHYLRDKEKKEVDFLTVREGRPERLIEAKISGHDVSSLLHFRKFFKEDVKATLLVKDIDQERFINEVEVKRASVWLAGLEA